MPPIRRSAYLLAATALVAFAVTLLWKPAPPLPFVGVRSDEISHAIGAWNSQGDDPVPPEVRDALPSAKIVYRTYTSPSSETPIHLILIGGTDRTALHDPRSCLIGAGFHLEDDHVESLPDTTVDIRACDAVGQPGQSDLPGYDIVYLYVVDGKIRNRMTQIRAEMLLSALLGQKNRPVYFLHFFIPLADDPAVRAANHQKLLHFAADTWKALAPRIVPGDAG